MEDEKIVALYWTRDENAIFYTHQKYGRYCYQIAYHILSDREDSEECINDTYLKTWNVIPPTKVQCLQMFLAKITRNLAFDKYRRSKAEKRGGHEISLVLDELSECIGESSTEKEIHQRQLNEAMNHFVKQLPTRERSVFIRRYFYTESIEEIAAKYELKKNHVYVLLSRSREKLKAYLQKEGYL